MPNDDLPANPVRIVRSGEGCSETAVAPPASVGDHTEQVLASASLTTREIRDFAAAGLI